ncbi:hypothetical protein C2E23DRAFT_579963 [Lenzites betulinus]|nr:hypothetical protein C2E23DRAFT_579963 [Lenzites betulinus]
MDVRESIGFCGDVVIVALAVDTGLVGVSVMEADAESEAADVEDASEADADADGADVMLSEVLADAEALSLAETEVADADTLDEAEPDAETESLVLALTEAEVEDAVSDVETDVGTLVGASAMLVELAATSEVVGDGSPRTSLAASPSPSPTLVTVFPRKPPTSPIKPPRKSPVSPANWRNEGQHMRHVRGMSCMNEKRSPIACHEHVCAKWRYARASASLACCNHYTQNSSNTIGPNKRSHVYAHVLG